MSGMNGMGGTLDAALAQAVVHDIKNALGLLEAELDTLARAGLAQVVPAHERCARLRQRLLEFLLLSQPEAQAAARIEPRAVEDVLLEAAADFVMPAHGRLRLEVALEPSAPVLWCLDERLVNLALHAALANAVAFAARTVTLGARAEDDHLVLWVRDDGPGFDAGPTLGGSGLGTAICERVAQAHRRGARHGSVMRRNAPGGGALFELRLP